MLHDPVTINLERRSAPATGITQAVYPVPQQLKAPLLLEAAAERRGARRAGLHAHEASRRPAGAVSRAATGVSVERIHGNRSQAQRTEALAGFKSGRYQVLVATDIAARGIDVDRARPRHQLRRADAARRLHPPRRPDGARRD